MIPVRFDPIFGGAVTEEDNKMRAHCRVWLGIELLVIGFLTVGGIATWLVLSQREAEEQAQSSEPRHTGMVVRLSNDVEYQPPYIRVDVRRGFAGEERTQDGGYPRSDAALEEHHQELPTDHDAVRTPIGLLRRLRPLGLLPHLITRCEMSS